MSGLISVSVIIIFLNEARFLDEAVSSVFAQTYDNWELLLVDDGSTDGSTATARRYEQRYPDKVQYLEHEGHANRGMSASRNLGIAHATGDYVAFLDADDVWLPHKLAQQVDILDAQPDAAMVYGPTEWWYSWTESPADAGRDFVLPLGITPNTLIPPPTLLTQFLANEGTSPCTCSILVRREVVEQVGGFEDDFRGLYEDQVFCAKVCLQFPVFASDQSWYRYRQHPASFCSVAQRTGQLRAARAWFLYWLRAYLRCNDVRDPGVWRALNRELRPYRYPALYQFVDRAYSVVTGLRARLEQRRRDAGTATTSGTGEEHV